jgi:hypothetical protein
MNSELYRFQAAHAEQYLDRSWIENTFRCNSRRLSNHNTLNISYKCAIRTAGVSKADPWNGHSQAGLNDSEPLSNTRNIDLFLSL